MPEAMTRRRLLAAAAATAAAAGLSSVDLDPWTREARATARRPGALGDIGHVVVLMQENRSFDHYFGTRPGVRGFADPVGRAAFRQRGFPAGTARRPRALAPGPRAARARLHARHHPRWGPQHRAWNGGRDGRLRRRAPRVGRRERAADAWATTTARTCRLYYALADAFTLCDAYHCSVLGPDRPQPALPR